MKTPEEVKKGLEACSADECHGQHQICPYKDDKFCMMHICGDALAYIKKLESRVKKCISVEGRLQEMPKQSTDAEYVCTVNNEPCCHCMPGSNPPCTKRRGDD